MITTSTGHELSDAQFRRIAAIAAEEAGLAIPEAKKSLVQSRIGKRMRTLELADFAAYLATLESDAGERHELISALTTNVSHFYREKHHFEHLRSSVLQSVGNRLRLWSAGCSNGQEAYTLAMEVLRSIPDAASRDILILASDIDEKVLARAQAGLYRESEMGGVSPEDRKRFFLSSGDGDWSVRPELRAMVRFRKLNLNGSWPMRGVFDAILCRNVVIYFSEETQMALWPRFRERLAPGGFLILGHSERIHPLPDSGFESVGVTTYRKLLAARQ